MAERTQDFVRVMDRALPANVPMTGFLHWMDGQDPRGPKVSRGWPAMEIRAMEIPSHRRLRSVW